MLLLLLCFCTTGNRFGPTSSLSLPLLTLTNQHKSAKSSEYKYTHTHTHTHRGVVKQGSVGVIDSVLVETCELRALVEVVFRCCVDVAAHTLRMRNVKLKSFLHLLVSILPI